MAAVTGDDRLVESVGLAVLDSAGRMNVAVGAGNPLVRADGSTGSRIAHGAGLTIYDPRDGKERGGMSAFDNGRANLCLDYDGGQKEAVCLTVAPGDQHAAVLLNGVPGEPQYDRVAMFVGADGRGSIKAFAGGNDNSGVMIRAGGGPPRITVHDSTGLPASEVLRH